MKEAWTLEVILTINLQTLSNENNFSEHIEGFWSYVPVNQWKEI